MRSAIKQLVKTSIRFNPIPLWRARGERLVPILRYHSIDAGESCLSTHPDVWRSHLRFFEERKLQVMSLADFFSARGDAADHTVVMTFDDGYRNNYEIAFPDLRSRGFSATFFVVPDCVGDHARWMKGELSAAFLDEGKYLGRSWEEFREHSELDVDYVRQHLPALLAGGLESCRREYFLMNQIEQLPMMSWPEIREMSRGRMDIGSHTLSHCHLSDVGESRSRREIEASKAIIEEEIQTEAGFFCYPYGTVPAHSTEQVRAAGYLGACTCDRGLFHPKESDPFELKRLDMEPVETQADLGFLLGRRHRGVLEKLLA